MSYRISFDELFKRFPLVIIDKCALMSSRDMIGICDYDKKKRVTLIKHEHKSYQIFNRFLKENKPLNVTDSIFWELKNGVNHGLSKTIIEKDEKKLRREVYFLLKEKRKLMSNLQEKKSIISYLTEEEKDTYQSIVRRYYGAFKKFGLSEQDIDFLMKGIIISKKKDSKLALISNDNGILNGYRTYMKQRNLYLNNFAFFTREKEKTLEWKLQ